MKEIKLDKHVKLLDCPGIVMSKEENMASLVLKNCIKVYGSLFRSHIITCNEISKFDQN